MNLRISPHFQIQGWPLGEHKMEFVVPENQAKSCKGGIISVLHFNSVFIHTNKMIVVLYFLSGK